MKKKLIAPAMLPPAKTIEDGYEYYTKPSLYGDIYYRRKIFDRLSEVRSNLLVPDFCVVIVKL